MWFAGGGSAQFFLRKPGLVSLAEIAGRGTRPMNRGGLAVGAHVGFQKTSNGVGKKLLVQKLGQRGMIFTWLNSSLDVASNGVVSNL